MTPKLSCKLFNSLIGSKCRAFLCDVASVGLNKIHRELIIRLFFHDIHSKTNVIYFE